MAARVLYTSDPETVYRASGETSWVITVGSFDGFHRGHQALILWTAERARSLGGHSLVMTFTPHPAKVIGHRFVATLQNRYQRARWLSALPVDTVWVLPFTHALAMLSPEQFLNRYVLSAHGDREIVVGTDFRFGAQRRGDLYMLRQFASVRVQKVHAFDTITLHGQPCRSSLVRRMIQQGAVERVIPFLGRMYSIEGIVRPGEGVGRTIGFPTANLVWFNELIPGNGVYITLLAFRRQLWPSVTNIGYRPTFHGKRLQIEVHVLRQTDLALYGQTVELFFLHRIRDERRFATSDALQRQIERDIAYTMDWWTAQVGIPIEPVDIDRWHTRVRGTYGVLCFPQPDLAWYRAHREAFHIEST